jgi:PII-like signaling protein
MPDRGPAARLMIGLDGDRTWKHKPMVHELIRRGYQAGLAGASACRGIDGFGATRRVHGPR